MPFYIVRQDITEMKVDAIVNAANTDLAIGGGVCGAVFNAAGADRMRAACNKIAPVKTGTAVVTPAFDLAAKFVIHAVGPIYGHRSAKEDRDLLRSAYTASLQLAAEHQCESIAFPLISAGIYGYPKEEAFQIATAAIKEFLADHDMSVYLVVFDRDSFRVGKELLGEVKSYIDDHYVSSHYVSRQHYARFEPQDPTQAFPPAACRRAQGSDADGLDSLIGAMDKPFNVILLGLIDAKGKTDTEVYKKANIDRKLFSKIRTGNGYKPGKRTILALAFALELNLAETSALLATAGYALSHSQKFDVIVEYFIVHGKYDIYQVNEVLFRYKEALLGGV